MGPDIVCKPSAFKHGVSFADIQRAVRMRISDILIDEFDDKYAIIGFDTNGNPIEIIYNFIDDKTIEVIHAMRCSRQLLELALRSVGNIAQKEKTMPHLTDEEANALDELMTKADLRLDTKPGVFARQDTLLEALDEASANYIKAKAEELHLPPTVIVRDMIRAHTEEEASH